MAEIPHKDLDPVAHGYTNMQNVSEAAENDSDKVNQDVLAETHITPQVYQGAWNPVNLTSLREPHGLDHFSTLKWITGTPKSWPYADSLE